MTRTRRPLPLPTRDEQRTIDNARPRGDLNPADCPMRGAHPLFDRPGNCGACGFPVFGSTSHCHLLEVCDHCYDAEHPCETAWQLRIWDKGAPKLDCPECGLATVCDPVSRKFARHDRFAGAPCPASGRPVDLEAEYRRTSAGG